MPEQVAEKVYDIGPFVGPLLYHHVEFTLGGDATDHREMVPRVISDNYFCRSAIIVDVVQPIFQPKTIRGFARLNGVHPGIVVGQLQHRGGILYSRHRNFLVPVRDFVLGTALADRWGHHPPVTSLLNREY